MSEAREICCGCGAELRKVDGPTHDYMRGSASCFAAFNRVLAVQYQTSNLMPILRLSVDCYAVQHPGSPEDRRAVQSVGLHLARLMLQVEGDLTAQESNRVMLDFSPHKATLRPLHPPARFRRTIADVAPFAGSDQHTEAVLDWCRATWADWSSAHPYIRDWVARNARQ